VRGNFELSNLEKITKKVGICYMPIKLSEIDNQVRMATRKVYPEVPWIEIDKVPESVVAERFRTYSMFFAAQHLEGCLLTALEAMACITLVAGFPGTEGLATLMRRLGMASGPRIPILSLLYDRSAK
jgi:hypothetical protein